MLGPAHLANPCRLIPDAARVVGNLSPLGAFCVVPDSILAPACFENSSSPSSPVMPAVCSPHHPLLYLDPQSNTVRADLERTFEVRRDSSSRLLRSNASIAVDVPGHACHWASNIHSPHSSTHGSAPPAREWPCSHSAVIVPCADPEAAVSKCMPALSSAARLSIDVHYENMWRRPFPV